MTQDARLPITGFAAWQATLGFISLHISPDAALEIQARSNSAHTVSWTASASWANSRESASDSESISGALSGLWASIERNLPDFIDSLNVERLPVGFADHEWLDAPTQDILHRLVWTTRIVFLSDWSLVIVYRPTENPSTRVHMRLLARSNQVHIGARGPGLLETARDLYRNAAPILLDYSERQ